MGPSFSPSFTPRSIWLAERLPSGIHFSVSSGDKIEWCPPQRRSVSAARAMGGTYRGQRYWKAHNTIVALAAHEDV